MAYRSSVRLGLPGAVLLVLVTAAIVPRAVVPASAQAPTVETTSQLLDELVRGAKWDEAAGPARQLVDLAVARYGADAPETAAAWFRLGDIYDVISRIRDTHYRDAEQAYKRAAEIYLAQRPDTRELAETSRRLADVYDSLGDGKQSTLWVTRARDIWLKLAPDSPELAITQTLIATIVRSGKQLQPARKTADEALATLGRSKLPETAWQWAYARFVLAGIESDIPHFPEAEALYVQAAKVLEGDRGPDPTMLGHAYVRAATMQRRIGKLATADDYIRKGIAERARVHGAEGAPVAAAMVVQASIQIAAGDVGGGERSLKEAIDIYNRQVPPAYKKIAEAMTSTARDLADMQRYDAADELHTQALEIRRDKLPDDISISLTNLAVTARAAGRLKDAEQRAKESIAAIDRAAKPNLGARASVELVLSGIYADSGRFDLAEPLAQSILEFRRKDTDATIDQLSAAYNLLAFIQRQIGKYAEAKDNYERVLELSKQQFGPDSPAAATVHSNLGGLYRSWKRYREAEQEYNSAIEIYRRGNPDDPAQTTTLLNLAVLYADEGRNEAAVPPLKRALELRRKAASASTDARIAAIEVQLADNYMRLGNYAEASAELRASIEAQTTRGADADLPLANAYSKLAEVLIAQNKSDLLPEARELLDKAIPIRKAKQGPAHIDVFRDLLREARTYQAQHQVAKYEQLMEEFRLQAQRQLKEVPILFGTDRNLLQPGGQAPAFGREIGDGMSVGRLPVSVLATAATSSEQRINDKGEVSEPASETTVKPECVPQKLTVDSDPAGLVDVARERMKSPGQFKDQALLFVHGFNVTFEQAVDFTCKFAWNLNFTGGVFLYSWPSHGSLGLRGYIDDIKRATGASQHLVDFIENVVAKTGARKVHIVAHSMGNRVLLGAIERLAARPTLQPVLGAVIMAAPDVDARYFRQNMPQLLKMNGTPILYTSTKDWALWLSRFVSKGDVPIGYFSAKEGPIVMKNLWTIDISETAWWGSSNHSTFANDQRMLSDMNSILAAGEYEPDRRSDRFTSVQAPGGGRYWSYHKVVKQP